MFDDFRNLNRDRVLTYFKSKLFSLFFKKDFVKLKGHKNNSFLLYSEKYQLFRKISFDKKGKKKLINEIQGLKWYYKRLKKKLFITVKKENKFFYFDINKINGFKVKSWHSLSQNYKYINRVVDHYLKYFPRERNVCFHGDLTLDNVIFSKKELKIIDWEFFGKKKTFWGYDILYLILSSICLPYIAKKKFTKKDEILFLKLWKRLLKIGLNKKLINNPFSFFQKKIMYDQVFIESYKISKKKFFPILTPPKFKEIVIKLIN